MRRIAFLVAAAVLAVCAPAPARQSALAPDGTVYVTGAFAGLPTLAPFGPTPQVLGLLRTRLDGTRVNDFGRGGFVAGRWDHVAVLPGGGVAAVRFDAGTVAVTRMDANGATVESGTASVPMSILEDVRALSASQVLLSGLRQESGTSWRLVVAVLRTDGAFDSGFGQGGVAMSQGTIEHPSDGGAPTFSPHAGTFRSYGGAPAWVLADGRILVGGPQLVARFTPSGAPDTSWGGDGEVTVGGQQGIVAATGDGAFVLELPDASHVRVHRLRADGTRDPAFGSAGAVTHQIAADAGAAVKDARVLDDGRLGFLLWPAGAESPARAYELTPDGATLNAGAPSASTGYSDLFSVGQDLDAIGPELDHFALTRYGTALQRTAVDILDIVSTAPRVTIVDGPPTAPGSITGASAHFRIAVERRPEDLGFGSVRCEVNYRDIPCGSEATVLTKTEGEGWTLTAYGVSIHGAEGPPVTYQLDSQPRGATDAAPNAPASAHAQHERADQLPDL